MQPNAAKRSESFWWVTVILALLGPLTGCVAALAATTGSAIPMAALQGIMFVIPALVAVWATLACVRSVRSRQKLTHLGSLIFGGGMVLAIAIPGAQLLSGARPSKLALLGFSGADGVADIRVAYALCLVALVFLVIGECTADLFARRLTPRHGGSRFRTFGLVGGIWETRSSYLLLIGTGLAATVIFHSGFQQEDFAQRGQTHGQGVLVTLEYCLPLGIAMGILAKHWGSKLLAALSPILAAMFLLLTGTRTPLLIVGTAIMIRLLTSNRSVVTSIRTAAIAAVMVYLGAVTLVGVSDWRSQLIRGQQASLAGSLLSASANPFGSLTEGGVDTLDGLVLSTHVDRETVGASWTDPAKAVINLIPFQIWPDKPPWLGAVVTHAYTRFGGEAGIFLSGPGYAFIVFNGVLGMALAFGGLGFVGEWIGFNLRSAGMGATLLAYFLLRFMFGGDAFDGNHVLSLLGVLIVVQFASQTARVTMTKVGRGNMQAGRRTPVGMTSVDRAATEALVS